MKRFLTVLFSIILFIAGTVSAGAELRPSDPRELPVYMDSYRNYMFVFVHGMGSSGSCFSGNDAEADASEKNLMEAVRTMFGVDDRAELDLHLFSDTFEDPYGGYHANAPQLGDRMRYGDACWLENARDTFVARFSRLYGRVPSANEIPKKYIMITHSMGSLAVRSYIYSDTIAASGVDPVNFPYGFYQNDVKKVVFISPTHRGSSMAEFLLNYVASAEGYEKEVSEPLASIISEFDLKGDTFESAWGKVKSYAQNKIDRALRDIKTQVENVASLDTKLDLLISKELQDSLGVVMVSIQIPKEVLQKAVRDIVKLYFQKERGDITEGEFESRLAEIENGLLSYIRTAAMSYGDDGDLGKARAVKNPWLQEQMAKGYALACRTLAESMYEEAMSVKDLSSLDRLIADVSSTNASLQNFTDVTSYNIIAQSSPLDMQIKAILSDLVKRISTVRSLDEIQQMLVTASIEVKAWFDQELSRKTVYTSWASLKSHYQGMLMVSTLEEGLTTTISAPPALNTWPVIQSSINIVIMDGPQADIPPYLKAQLDAWVKSHTSFQSWDQFQAWLSSLDLNTVLKDVLDEQVRTYTDYGSWDELRTALARVAVVLQQLARTMQDVFTDTNGACKTWQDLQDYLKTISFKVLFREQLDAFAKKYSSFDTWEELEVYLRTLNISDELKKAFLKVQYTMENEGYSFLVNIAVGEDWPFNRTPQVKLHWQNWTQISVDMASLSKEMNDMIDSYELTVRLTDGTEFRAKVSEVEEAIQKLSALSSPIPRLLSFLSEIGSLPPFTATPKLLIDANSLLASQQTKDLIDQVLTKVLMKRALEEGAVMSLLPSDPVTKLLKDAELPSIYDPIEYVNIIPRGSVAFDKRETEEFNQFFYGDLPALRGAFTQLDSFLSWGFMPSILANAYQIKLISIPKFQKLPTAESRLYSVLYSYSRGLFTKEGDGAVDIDSLRGKDVRHLSGARSYERLFVNKIVNSYIDTGIWRDAEKIDTGIILVQLFVPLPPPVVGAIRCVPMFTLGSKVINNSAALADDVGCHSAILKNKYSAAMVKDALFDDPLAMFTGIYIVSGNERTRVPVSQYQEQTDVSQVLCNAPVMEENGTLYNPLAFNVSGPMISVQGLVKDLAPHKCTLEYSYNFAPYITKAVDRDGVFSIENLRVAEGQNILALKVTNMVGRSRTQFIRIIRSSSPLLPSNMLPMQDDMVNTVNVPISMDFYNAQFVSNNIEVTDLTAFRIDDVAVDMSRVSLDRGYVNAYCNKLHVSYPAVLAEGSHTVEVAAADSYGHTIFGRWTFIIDTTPPAVTLDAISDVRPVSGDGLMTFYYSLQDTYARQFKDVSLKLLGESGKTVASIPCARKQTAGPHSVAWDGLVNGRYLEDGRYMLVLNVEDEAGNRTEVTSSFCVDTTPPVISLFELGTGTYSALSGSLAVKAYVNEANNVSADMVVFHNIERNVNITVPLDLAVSGNGYAGVLFLKSVDGYFLLPDGRYDVHIVAEDKAGNRSESVTRSLLVDTTPPLILEQYATPLVLSSETDPPYATNFYYRLEDTTSVTTNSAPVRSLKVQVKVIERASGRVITEFSGLPGSAGLHSVSWQPGTQTLKNGVYVLRLKVTDIYGNCAYAESEIIKDGIQPQITVPSAESYVQGTVALQGTISDADWTNIKEFESYAVYCAEGRQAVPSDLQHLDSIWRATGIEVPVLNRKTGQTELGRSYRTVQDAIIAFWDTTAYDDGEYTVLVVSNEKDLGATGAFVRTYAVDNTSSGTRAVPEVLCLSFPVSVDYAVTASLSAQFMNTNKNADVTVVVQDRAGQVVHSKYFPDVPGAVQYGKPVYESGQEYGIFIWADTEGWHLRLNSDAIVSGNYEGLLSGITNIHAPKDVPLLPYVIEGPLVRFSGAVEKNKEYGVDFELSSGSTSLFFDLDLGCGGTIENAEKVFIGRSRYNPPAAQYALSTSGTASSSCFMFTWDGKKDSGAYADNGEYTLKVIASGADGFGYSSASVTVNIRTPYTFTAGTMTPPDGTFGAFSSIDRVSLKYSINKDSYVTAYVRYAGTTEKVSDILFREKIYASTTEKSVTWNGAYPKADSTVRKVNGDYELVLEAVPCDGSAASQSVVFSNIHIRSTASTINAVLSPIGSEIMANGQKVRYAEGSSEYYFAARAEGKYYEPRAFNYQVNATGEQLVSVNPYVPFALLYHRGFNEAKFRVVVGATAAGNSVFSSGSWRRVYWSADSGLLVFTKKNTTYTFYKNTKDLNSYRNGTYIDGFSFSSSGITNITLSDMYGNVMLSEDLNLPYIGKHVVLRGMFLINWEITQDPSSKGVDGELSVTITLLDNVQYSRLTNRYFAWFGWTNKNSPVQMDFASLFNDHARLGFPGTAYFSSPNYYANSTLNAVLSSRPTFNFCSASINVSTIDGKQAYFKQFLFKEPDYGDPVTKNDETYRNYLGDEYTEIIPIVPTGGSYQVFYDQYYGPVTGNPSVVAQVVARSQYSRLKREKWPAQYEEIVQKDNEQDQLIASCVKVDQILSKIDLENLYYNYDARSIDLGGLNRSWFIMNGAIGTVQKKYSSKPVLAMMRELHTSENGLQDLAQFDLPPNVIADTVKLELTKSSAPGVDLYFEGADRAKVFELKNNGSVRVLGVYADMISSNAVHDWSTEMDPQLKDGLVRGGPCTFNASGFAPESPFFHISDYYPYAGQLDVPITNYFFLDHEYGSTGSVHVLNPNLELNRLDVAVYDRTGAVDDDLEATGNVFSNSRVLENKFKVRLKFDAVEKKYLELHGSAAGPFDLMYFDGSSWRTVISSTINAAIVDGLLGHIDVGRLNGKYTVALKVYDGTYGSAKFNIATQEVYFGSYLPVRSQESLAVYSPYKRASVRFAPGSYTKDTFITVTPTDLSKLSLSNPPDISSVGPIVEILPHGSTFDAQHRPTLVYNYSQDDMNELKQRGVNPADLHIYYVNETGELEAANSLFSYVTENALYQFTAELSHFSPYTMLEGDVPPLPTVYAATNAARSSSVRIFGHARPNSALRVYVDDDGVLEDKDIERLQKKVSYSTNTAEWVLNARSYTADYTDKLSESIKEQVLTERALQKPIIEDAIVSNDQVQRQWQSTILKEVAASESRVISEVRTDLLDAGSSAPASVPVFGRADMSAVCTKDIDPILQTKLMACRNTAVTAPAIVVPEYKRCLPPSASAIEVIDLISTLERSGCSAVYYEVTADADGYYSADISLLTVPSCTVFVTYKKDGIIKNRPVARFSMDEDPDAPRLSAFSISRKYVNAQNRSVPVTFNITTSETGRVNISCIDGMGKVLRSVQVTMDAGVPMEYRPGLDGLSDGRYVYAIAPVDQAGNIGFPQAAELILDTVPPTRSLIVPKAFNPFKQALAVRYGYPEAVSVCFTVRNVSGNVIYAREFLRTVTCNDLLPAKTSADYVNTSYQYDAQLVDQAGNTILVTGSFTVDTVPPLPPAALYGYGRSLQAMMSWPAVSDDVTYRVVRCGAELSAMTCSRNQFADKRVSSDTFYSYSVSAVDEAENQSTFSEKVIVYTADDTAQSMGGGRTGITVNYLGCTAVVSTASVSGDMLFVVQRLKGATSSVPVPRFQGKVLVGTAYRLLASGAHSFDVPVQVELCYAGLPVSADVRMDTMKIAYYDGRDWSTYGLIDQEIDTVNMVVRARTMHFTDFVIIADRDLRSFDTAGPRLTFETLRPGDYFDPSVTISVLVNEQLTPIDTSSLRLFFDGTTYVLASSSFIDDPVSYNGRISFNLNMITGGVTYGNHTVQVRALDSAGNTGNVEASFTWSNDFTIKEVVNVPNPFEEDGTYFTYQLSQPAAKITIKIFDTNGRLIREIENCSRQIGFNKVFWDGDDQWGEFVANDVYLYIVICEDQEGEKVVVKGKCVAMR